MVLEERKEKKNKIFYLSEGEIFIKILLTNAINSYVERKMAPPHILP